MRTTVFPFTAQDPPPAPRGAQQVLHTCPKDGIMQPSLGVGILAYGFPSWPSYLYSNRDPRIAMTLSGPSSKKREKVSSQPPIHSYKKPGPAPAMPWKELVVWSRQDHMGTRPLLFLAISGQSVDMTTRLPDPAIPSSSLQVHSGRPSLHSPASGLVDSFPQSC